jgi:cellulose biosynthesis protein BcsQ
VQDSLNPTLQVLGVLLNKAFDGEESTFIQEQLRASGLHVFDTTIPVNKLASKAAAGGVPTALAHRNYEIGKIYRRAADEISDRLTATFADTDKLQEAGSR